MTDELKKVIAELRETAFDTEIAPGMASCLEDWADRLEKPRLVTGARPEMGDLKPGQNVIVRRSYNDSRRRKPEDNFIPAVVVKANRVWIELKTAESIPDNMRWMTWRMRRDTQDEGTQYPGSDASFATLEQHAYDETRTWALQVLRGNGIGINMDSPWRGREVELADLISKATS